MPRQETIISVFVGSPGDVSDEREALETIIAELNKTWSRTLNIRLELTRWETDAYPSFGKDPQDVINNQLEVSADVFIGIFWGRIGTETERDISGTVEEFNNAYEKHKEDENSIDILIYFKDAPLPPSKIDPDQLAKLMTFKSQLGPMGGLYWEFDSLADFEATLRSHLSLVAQKWTQKLTNQVQDLSTDDPYDENEVELNEDENDLGFLDHLEAHEDFSNEMDSSLKIIAEATENVGLNMNKRTAAIKDVGEVDTKEKLAKAKKIVKLSALDLERYSSVLNTQLPILSKSRLGSFEALSQALACYRDFAVEDSVLEQLQTNIETMRQAAFDAKMSMVSFRNTIKSFPRLISQMNQAKKKAVLYLDRVTKEIENNIRISQNIIDSIIEIRKENEFNQSLNTDSLTLAG